MTEMKSGIRDIIVFAVLLSGTITLILFVTTFVAEFFLHDLSFFADGSYTLRLGTIKMICYVAIISVFFVYLPFRARIQEKIISKKRDIILVILLTYLLSSILLAFFLSFTTEMIDYDSLARENIYTRTLMDEKTMREEKGLSTFNLTFNFRESFFDAVSGFTTTGLTAFEEPGIGVSKIDAQPYLIHIIRAAYLWIGGLGIMFFYLYFAPVPSLMMSMGYEIAAERSLPRFIRLEGLSFSLVYFVITVLGVLFLFLSISSAISETSTVGIENETKLTYSIILTFSSISTGGFSPGSAAVDQLQIEESRMVVDEMELDKSHILGNYLMIGDEYYEIDRYHMINTGSLLIIMVLMVAGAMPIFSLHRPLKFLRRWKLFAVFLLPIVGYAVFSYSEGPQVAFYRAFDAISAFTTTGLYTSQFEDDFLMPQDSEYRVRYNEERIMNIYHYRERSMYIIALMFIGGAAYSTAGGWGFFNFFFVLHVLYLILTGKLERALSKYILKLIMSFLLFFSIFALGTLGCYASGLFGSLSGPEPAAAADYVMNSAFYEISALSTVGLMPEDMIQDGGIYYNLMAYVVLVFSMLAGRLYFVIFPFLVSPNDEGGN